MTKHELIEFMKPFTDEVRIVLDCGDEYPPIYREPEPRYVMVDGEGIIVLAQGGIT